MRKTDALEGDPRPGLDQRVAELKGSYKGNDSCDSRASDGACFSSEGQPHPHASVSVAASRATVLAPGCECSARGRRAGGSEAWQCRASQNGWGEGRRAKGTDGQRDSGLEGP